LYSCGFHIEEEGVVDHVFYFVVKKVRSPFYDMNPTYGAFIKLRRIGKGGRAFNVYKFRTMHPFSEYLQAYVYQLNQLDEGGKMKDDFRITTLGRLMRKLWIDEWPMLINLLKGDMKLVGVRPLSKHYFALYSEETQRIRTLVKPGLIPPFYADSPKTLEEIQSSEIKYVKAYLKHPWITDIRYFFRVMYNIFVKGARSS
jgi:lipopolysaccharide/colanic/teichoic acid biosynthesis glycosyltransferase